MGLSPLAFPACLAVRVIDRDSVRRRFEAALGLEFWKMAMKLYVGNLSYDLTSSDLEELFAEFGAVRSAQVIMDRDTGRSKGFGFVEFSDDNAARSAIQALNEKEHQGRRLMVNEARPREDRGGGGGGGRRRY